MSFSAFDHQCMAEALQLARNGLNSTHPNPRVGCILAKGRRLVGRGWHHKTGEAHAEINALLDAGIEASGSTAYVTLEPCSHSGQTPPCVNALIEAKVARVIFAIEDPNPDVSGNGARRLQSAGIEVQGGLMAVQAEELNQGFFKRMRSHRPWVRLKLAQSLDGHICLANGSSQWISGPDSRADVQKWRARSDVILTGIGTVLADDPSMNVRANVDARQPARVIVDSQWRTPANAKIIGLAGEVIIAGLDEKTVPQALKNTTANCIHFPARNGRVDLKVLLAELGQKQFNEVQVEAGSQLCGALLADGLVDEILIYQAPILLGGGAVSPFATPRLDNMDDRVHLEWVDSRRIGQDIRLRLRPVSEAKALGA